MKNKSLYILVISFFILFSTNLCKGQKKLYNEEFQWSIILPEGFEDASNEQKEEFIEEKNSLSHPIFLFKNGPFNYFDATYQNFNASEGNYSDSFNETCQLLYDSFKNAMPEVNVTKNRATEEIDQLEFQSCNISISHPENPVNMTLYGRTFKDKELFVTIVYTDTQNENTMNNFWKASKFKK